MNDFAPPWADPQWHDEATAWIQERLASLGYRLTRPPETLNQWELSCVLRVPVEQSSIFFKAGVPWQGYNGEATLLPALAHLFPADVPRPLAVEADRHWLLLPDIGRDMRSAGKNDESVWVEALRRFARLQIMAVGQLDALLPDQRLDRFAGHIETLIVDHRAVSVLNNEERQQLRQRLGGWMTACGRLAQSAIPQTIVHGDLHGGNIAFKDGSYRFFDWADASISYPFFDLFVFLNDAERQGASLESLHRLRDAYLLQWIDYDGLEGLWALYQLSAPLAALHQAIIYNRIADALRLDAERRRVGEWLRKSLR